MSPKLVKEWIEALESGKYSKGVRLLNQGENYCCLGVLCEIKDVKKSNTSHGSEYHFPNNHKSTIFPTAEFLKYVGLSEAVANQLVEINDRSNTFAPIVDYLKELKFY